MPVSMEDLKQYRMRQSPIAAGKRLPSDQGLGEEVQTTPKDRNTGVGEIVGGLATGLATRQLKPLSSEIVSGAGAELGDVLETALLQAVDPEREVNVGSLIPTGSVFLESLIGGGAVRGGAKAFDVGKFAVKKGVETVRHGIASKIHSVPMTPEAQVADRVLSAEAKKLNIPTITPAESTKSAWLDFFDNIGKNSIIGSEIYRDFLEKRFTAIDKVAAELVAPYGKVSRDPGSIGDMLIAVTSDNSALADIPAKVLRNTVEHNAFELGLEASVKDIRRHAALNIKAIEKTGDLGAKRRGKGPAQSLLKATKGESDEFPALFPGEMKALEDISNSIKNLPESAPVGDIIQLRSDLLDVQRGIRESKKLKNAPISKFVGEQIGLMNQAIEEGLRQPGATAELLPMWKRSNTIFKMNAKQFGDKLATQLIKNVANNPAGVANAILKSEKENGFRIAKKAKNILVPDSLNRSPNLPVPTSNKPWVKLQSFLMDDLVEGSRDPISNVIDGPKLLRRTHEVGEGTLSVIYGAKTAREIMDFAKTVALTQSRNPISTGAMGIQMVQMGASLSFFNQVSARAVTVLLGPAQIAKIMTMPKGAALMKKAITMSRSDPRMTALASRLIAMASMELIERDAPQPEARVSSSPVTSPLAASLMSPAFTQ